MLNLRMPETTHNQSSTSAIGCGSFGGENEWIVGFSYRQDSNPMISKHPFASAETLNIESAKSGHFQAPFPVLSRSSEALISNSSEIEGFFRQQDIDFTEASSSGCQAARESPSMHNSEVYNMKSFKIISRNSLEIKGGAHSSVVARKKSQLKLEKLNYNQGFKAKKKNYMVGALGLLLDAIQLVEGKDQLKGEKEKAKGISYKPGLESHHWKETDYSSSTKKMIPYEVSHRGFSGDNDRGHVTKRPGVQGRHKRLQALPSRFSDSVLLPWK